MFCIEVELWKRQLPSLMRRGGSPWGPWCPVCLLFVLEFLCPPWDLVDLMVTWQPRDGEGTWERGGQPSRRRPSSSPGWHTSSWSHLSVSPAVSLLARMTEGWKSLSWLGHLIPWHWIFIQEIRVRHSCSLNLRPTFRKQVMISQLEMMARWRNPDNSHFSFFLSCHSALLPSYHSSFYRNYCLLCVNCLPLSGTESKTHRGRTMSILLLTDHQHGRRSTSLCWISRWMDFQLIAGGTKRCFSPKCI